jgi:hypothetical protein
MANRQLLVLVGGLIGTALGIGSAAVALYGIRQRLMGAR